MMDITDNKDRMMRTKEAVRYCKELLMFLNHRLKTSEINSRMIEIFKTHFKTAVHNAVTERYNRWEPCLERLQALWGLGIDEDEVMKRFVQHCQCEGLPYNTFNRVRAFNNAHGCWRSELMLSVANGIVREFVPVKGLVVRLSPGLETLIVDRSCIFPVDEIDDGGFREECDCGLPEESNDQDDDNAKEQCYDQCG